MLAVSLAHRYSLPADYLLEFQCSYLTFLRREVICCEGDNAVMTETCSASLLTISLGEDTQNLSITFYLNSGTSFWGHFSSLKKNSRLEKLFIWSAQKTILFNIPERNTTLLFKFYQERQSQKCIILVSEGLNLHNFERKRLVLALMKVATKK